MPRGDGTGPTGLGPMTGRAAGYCAGYPVPGYMNPIPGRASFRGYFGVGRGGYPRGGGRGRAWGGGRGRSWGGIGFGWRSPWTPPPFGAYAPPTAPYAY